MKNIDIKKIKMAVLVLTVFLLTGCLGPKPLEKGVSYLEEERFEEALEVFEEEAEKEENPGEAYRGMGIAYFELDEFEKSILAFENALRNGAAKTGTIYNLMGISHMKLEEYEAACEAFEKGITMEDCSEEMKQEMQFNLIAAYEKSGDWASAKEKVNKYLTQYPDDARAKKEAEFLESR